jgi:hypothetical protein
MALVFRRWGVPVISVAFTTGLQLSNVVQETVGWVLIAVAAVAACVYVYFERRTETREATMTSGDENTNTGGGDQNINYGSQEVGINKGIINREVPPSAHVRKIKENEPRGAQFVTTYHVDLEGRPPMLGVAASGSSDIQIVGVHKQGGGGLFGVEEGSADNGTGYYKAFKDPPPGRYVVEVFTAAPVNDMKFETFEAFI